MCIYTYIHTYSESVLCVCTGCTSSWGDQLGMEEQTGSGYSDAARVYSK